MKKYLTNNFGKVVLYTNEKDYTADKNRVNSFRESTPQEIKAAQAETVARVKLQEEQKKNWMSKKEEKELAKLHNIEASTSLPHQAPEMTATDAPDDNSNADLDQQPALTEDLTAKTSDSSTPSLPQ